MESQNTVSDAKIIAVAGSHLDEKQPGFSPLLKPRAAAELLGVSTSALAAWRFNRTVSLRYVLCGTSILYRLSDIQDFIKSRTVDGLAGPAKSLHPRRGGPGRPARVRRGATQKK